MPYCDICQSETCEHQDRSCPCGCGDKPNVNCVYDTPEQRHLKNLMNDKPDEQWVTDGTKQAAQQRGPRCIGNGGTYLRHRYEHNICVRCGTPRYIY